MLAVLVGGCCNHFPAGKNPAFFDAPSLTYFPCPAQNAGSAGIQATDASEYDRGIAKRRDSPTRPEK